MTLEKTYLTLGFVALTDCAPLAVAKARGFFASEGLEVELSREASWANIRDRTAAGLLDGAHMLGPMAIAQTLGVGADATPLCVPMARNLNGSAITLSRALAEEMRLADPQGCADRARSARALRRVIEARRLRGRAQPTFAVVFPYSVHTYELRYWLAAGGVDPDRDIRLMIAPPPRMAEKLAEGEIDGFCVGAPWSALAVERGLGEVVLNASEWWGACADKVFGVTSLWAARHPKTLQAVLRALLRAAVWADAPENRSDLAALLARPQFVGVAEPIIRMSLASGGPDRRQTSPGGDLADHVVFHRHGASFPWRSQAQWFLSQMVRWGQAPRDVSFAGAAAVYRPDLYRQAAASLGLTAPIADSKLEGARRTAWIQTGTAGPIAMAADAFFDGAVFDPAAPLAYLDALPAFCAATEMGAAL
jgi:ABC-type nitrate/sulfonate/bicarbonate transport system substrate-binding protein